MVEMDKNNPTIPNPSSALPEGWRWVRLGEVCEICQYGLTTVATAKGAYPYIRITDFDDLGNIKTGGMKFIDCDENTCKKYALKEGDILFARSGSVGRTFLYSGVPPKAVFASYLIRFRLKQELINPLWLFYFTHSPHYYEFIKEKTHTVSQPNVNAQEYKSLFIPLPPFPEQKRIAAKVQELMAEVERARTACEKQLEAAKTLPSAYLRQVFESDEAQKWVKGMLGEVCEIIMGQSPPGHTYNKDGKGLPFFQGKVDFGEVYPTPSSWCTEPKKVAESNDVLISVRAPVGPTNLCNEKSCIGRGLAAIRSKGSINSQFILFFLRFIERDISKTGQGSTFGAIKREHLESMSIPFPPLPIQQRLASQLKEKMTQAERLKASIEKQMDAINALPQAILKKAFIGEM